MQKPFQTLDHAQSAPCPSSSPAVGSSELAQELWGCKCTPELLDSTVRLVVLLCLLTLTLLFQMPLSLELMLSLNASGLLLPLPRELSPQ